MIFGLERFRGRGGRNFYFCLLVLNWIGLSHWDGMGWDFLGGDDMEMELEMVQGADSLSWTDDADGDSKAVR